MALRVSPAQGGTRSVVCRGLSARVKRCGCCQIAFTWYNTRILTKILDLIIWDKMVYIYMVYRGLENWSGTQLFTWRGVKRNEK